MKRNKSIYAVIEVIFLGVIALLPLFINKQFVSIFMTAGIVVGNFIGNFLGGFIEEINKLKIVEGMKAEEVYRFQHNPGFEIWISIILLSIILGSVFQTTVIKKHVK